jgi:hypothetical protein
MDINNVFRSFVNASRNHAVERLMLVVIQKLIYLLMGGEEWGLFSVCSYS